MADNKSIREDIDSQDIDPQGTDGTGDASVDESQAGQEPEMSGFLTDVLTNVLTGDNQSPETTPGESLTEDDAPVPEASNPDVPEDASSSDDVAADDIEVPSPKETGKVSHRSKAPSPDRMRNIPSKIHMGTGASDTKDGTGRIPAQAPSNTGRIPTQAPSNTGRIPTQTPSNTGRIPAQVPSNTGRIATPIPSNTGRIPTQAPANTGRITTPTGTGRIPAQMPQGQEPSGSHDEAAHTETSVPDFLANAASHVGGAEWEEPSLPTHGTPSADIRSHSNHETSSTPPATHGHTPAPADSAVAEAPVPAVVRTGTRVNAPASERPADSPAKKKGVAAFLANLGKGKRTPIVLGIITVACLIIAATSFGLQWMARHGGGTGDPVEATSEVDNTPIPMPHITGLGMVNISFRSSTAFRISSGNHFIEWNGSETTGDLAVENVNTVDDTTLVSVVPQEDMDELVIDFSCRDQQAFMSMSAALTTEDNGALMMTGSINNLPSTGTARIKFSDYRMGVTNSSGDNAVTANPVINVTTSYTVGDGNKDYAGSYVSCSSSLSMGVGNSESYLSTGQRSITVSAPNGFGQGDILQTGRTTIRQNGVQNSIAGTVLLPAGEKEYESTYEKMAENDQSNKVMGREQANAEASGDKEQTEKKDADK